MKLQYKELWGPGEWQQEPDIEEFKYKGFECKVIRNGFGCWCGYTKLPFGHRYHKVHYNDIPLDIHGGLTYSAEKQDGTWLIGFDCGHYNDFVPAMECYKKLLRESDTVLSRKFNKLEEKYSKYVDEPKKEEYRNIEFARNQCKSMVDQLIELQESNN